jgi:hypothetical protein
MSDSTIYPIDARPPCCSILGGCEEKIGPFGAADRGTYVHRLPRLPSNEMRHAEVADAGAVRLAQRRQRAHYRGGACLHSQLIVDALQVLVHGARADAEDGGNVPIGLAGGKPMQHVSFAWC